MSGQRKLAALLFIISIAACLYFTGKGLVPPEVVPAGARPDVFSAARAFPYLQAVAREPHSVGGSAIDRVRNYITGYCKKQGLETQVQKAVGFNRRNYRLIAGEAHNIIARLKGTAGGKAVLVAGHYDSQPNTPGAGDNGCAVAAMMETIDLLLKGPPLRNDVIFLFTDLEEPGQIGAEAFVSNYPGIDSIGVVLNFDARGNAGLNYIFETSGGNSWLMRELSAAVDRPVANSLAYEVYTRMPNASDFTVFKSKGIPGWNTAFIDGYSSYHSMTDTPENLDMRTFQHQGELMLNAVRHFANLDLSHPSKENAIFFNPAGSWFWIYSYTADYVLVGITVLLFVAYLIIGFRKRALTVKRLASGMGWYLLSILVLAGLVWLLCKWVLAAYPKYLNFNSANAYNAKYYLLTLLGAALLVFVAMYGWIGRRLSAAGLYAGALLVLMVTMLFLKYYMPTGAYILYIPLIPVLLGATCMYRFDISFDRKPWVFTLMQAFQWLLPLSLWGTFVYLLFVVFSLSFPFPAAAFAGLFIPLLIPLRPLLAAINSRLLTVMAVCLMLAGAGMAHFNAGSTDRHPQPTQLMYGVNIDAREAVWVSGLPYKDAWVNKYIPATAKSPFDEFYQGFGYYVWKNKAPYLEQPAATVTTAQDTLVNGSRQLKLLIIPGAGTSSLELLLNDKILATGLAARSITHDPRVRLGRISFFAPPPGGVLLECSVKEKSAARLLLLERRWGLPAGLLTDKLPENMIFGPDYMSNSLQVKQTVTL